MMLTKSVKEEYDSVKTGLVWMERKDRGILSVSGEDRLSWLQSLLSNDIFSVNELHQAIPAFLLSPSGHVLADINVIRREDDLLLDMPFIVLNRILKYLNRYIIEERVELADQTGLLNPLSVQGVAATEEIAARYAGGRACLVSADHTGYGGFDIFTPAAMTHGFIQSFAQANIPQLSEVTMEILRVEAGLLKYGVDMDDTTLAPECDPKYQRISFTKGCYPGQEVVARIVARGHVNRTLCGFQIDSTAIPTGRVKLYFTNGESSLEAGWITSSVFSRAMGSIIALGYVRREYSSYGASLKSLDVPLSVTATVVPLPFGASLA